MVSDAVNPEIIKRRMWLDYQRATSDPANERIECIHGVLDKFVDPDLDINAILQETANTIATKLFINEVTIGLKDPDDGLYKYVVMHGLEDSEWEAHKTLSYTREQFDSQEVYKFKEISKHTRLYLAEDNPYGAGEDATYSKELMLKSSRKSIEDAIEGDYLDTMIYGKNDELLGWIEYSGMNNGKFPDGQTIKCIELVVSGIAIVLSLRRRA